jgi:hypothetical protein
MELIVTDPIDIVQRRSPGLSGAGFNTAGNCQSTACMPTLNI